MSYELEAKVKVNSHEPLRVTLASIGARRFGKVLESNHIYDDEERTLLAAGRGVRIRTHDAANGDHKPSTLTYKGKLRPGPKKHRREIQVELDDGMAGRAILDRLGYVEVMCFEKRRETWEIGDCLVELDEVPYLGYFIEVEGPNHERIDQVLAQLGLGDEPMINNSYVRLLRDYCEANALSPAEIRFQR
jgi:adenylate cyclase class 2